MTITARPFAHAALTLIGLTALAGAVVAVVPGLAGDVRGALGLDPAAPPRSLSATAIFAHNLRPVAGILLAALAASRLGRGRVLLDGALIAFAAVNATAIGATLGAYGTPAARRLAHVPLEYGALIVAAGSYLAHRHSAPRPAPFALIAIAAVTLLAAGAFLESHPLR